MFWDSSAIVPLLAPEPQSGIVAELLTGDRDPTMWWGSPLECHAALYRAHRERRLDDKSLAVAAERLRAFGEHSDTITPSDDVRRRAARLVAVHPLRAADALQLAAALLWCEEQPHGETFVTLDLRLRDAAQREGFAIKP